MEELLQSEPEAGGEENPRLQAILELLKFLSQSEGKRAMPPEEAAPMPPEAPMEGEPDEDELEALKSLAR